MRHKLLIYLFLLFTSFCLAQYNISGYVVNSNQLPIANAHIDINSKCTNTDVNGFFKIENLRKKNLQIKIQKKTFEPYLEHIKAPQNKPIVFELLKTSENLSELVIDTYHLSTTNEKKVTREDLLEEYAGGLAQTLSNQAGLEVSSVGSQNGKITMRSMGLNRIAITENGAKQEGQQWGADHGLELDALQIERISILKGVGAIEYGSDAIAGVIEVNNEVTPEVGWHGSGFTGFKSNNKSIVNSWNISNKSKEHFFKLKGSFTRYADFKIPADTIIYLTVKIPLYENKMTNTAGKESSFMAQWGMDKNDFKSILSVSNFNSSAGFFAGAHGIPSNKKTKPRSNDYLIDLPLQKVNHTKVNLHLKKNYLHSQWDLFATYQRNHRQELSAFHSHFPSQPMPQNNTLEFDFKLHTFDIKSTFSKEWNISHKTKLGSTFTHKKNTINGYSFLLPEYKQYNMGVFGTYQWEISNEKMFELGVRWDLTDMNIASYFDEYMYQYLIKKGTPESESKTYAQRSTKLNQFNQQGNISLGYTFHLNENYHSSFTLSSNFRMPTAMELSANGLHHGAFRHEKGNPNLNPEKGWAVDWNHKLKHNALTVDFSSYAYYFTNYIYLQPSFIFSRLPHGGQVYQYNQSQALISGADAEFNYTIENWEFNSALEYNYTQQLGESVNYPLPFSTPSNGLFSVAYHLPLKKYANNITFYANCKHFMTQNRIARNELITPNYTLFNLKVSSDIHFPKKTKSKITLQITNLLNNAFYEHNSFYRPLNIPGLGRSFNIQFLTNF